MKRDTIRKIGITVIALLLMGLIGSADYLTGYKLSFSIFYLLPIGLAAWKNGKFSGYIVSVLCALTWFAAEYTATDESVQVLHLTWNMLTRLGYFLIVVYFLSKQESALSNESVFARTDPLTGARNRRAFNELLEKEIGRSQRYKRPFSLAYIDCDNFKKVNDTLGHKTGDQLLRAMVQIITSSMRTMDVFGRFGGDEFVLLMPETDEQDALDGIKRIRDLVQGVMDENGWPVTLSIGISTFNNPVSGVADVLEKADKLMYSAKDAGKNKIMQGTF